MNSSDKRCAVLHTMVALVGLAAGAVQGQTVVTWTGAAGNQNWSDPLNWNPNVVPSTGSFSAVIPAGATVRIDPALITSLVLADLTLGSNATLQFYPGRSLTVERLASIGGVVDQSLGGSTFTTQPGTTTFTSDRVRVSVGSGATSTILGPVYDTRGIVGNSTLMSAVGGGVINASAMTNWNGAWNDDWSAVQRHLVSAVGTGSTINLSGLVTLSTPARGEDRIDFEASGGGVIRLDQLQSISGGGGARLVATGGSLLSLPSLAIVNSTGGAVTIAPGAAAFSLPAMVTANGLAPDLTGVTTWQMPALTGANRMTLTVPGGSTFNAPALGGLTSSSLTLEPGGTFAAPQLSSITGTQVSVSAGSTLNTAPITQFDNSRLSVTGPITVSLSDSSLAMTGWAQNATVLSATGGGVINASAMTNWNGAWNDDWSAVQRHLVSAVGTGSTINLSGLVTLSTPARGEDRIDFEASGGGVIRLDQLQSISGGGGARLVASGGSLLSLPSLTIADSSSNAVTIAPVGATFSLPALVSANGLTPDMTSVTTWQMPALTGANRMTLTVPGGSTFNAPALGGLTSSSLTLEPGGTFAAPQLSSITGTQVSVSAGSTLNTAPITQFDNSRLSVTGPITVSLSDSSLAMTGWAQNATVLSATGGGVINASAMTNWNGAWNDDWGGVQRHLVSAVGTGSTINLSGLVTLTTPARGEDRIDFEASGGGVVNVGRLASVSGGGSVRFATSSGGRIILGDNVTFQAPAIFELTDPGSSLSFSGTAAFNSGRLAISNAASLVIDKHMTIRLTAEPDFQLTTGILRFPTPGLHMLEVAGVDVGPVAPGNNGNFGIGRIEVGTATQPAVLQLLDLVDNGNRGGALPEALYVFGVGQGTNEDSLVLYGGSTLYLDNINVYARENGNWIWLNSLFGPGQSVVAYSGGYLHLPSPGAVSLLAAAGLLAARRRRGGH